MAFVDDIVNALNDYAHDGVDYVEGKLRATAPNGDVAAGANRVHELLQKSLDTNFDNFELYLMQHILKIPSGVELPVTTSFERSFLNQTTSTAATTATTTATTTTARSTPSLAHNEEELDNELDALMLRIETLRASRDALRLARSSVTAQLGAIAPLADACATLRDCVAIDGSVGSGERRDVITTSVERVVALQRALAETERAVVHQVSSFVS